MNDGLVAHFKLNETSGTFVPDSSGTGNNGTLIGDNVRLERIDSQLGLAAIYTAILVTRDGERRLEGRWESTNLAAGMAQSGTWMGEREKEQ